MITQIIKNTTLPLFLLISNSEAGQGTFITEPFSCGVALADYAELQKRLEITPRTAFEYPMLLSMYEGVVKDLEVHSECEEVQNGK